MILSKTTGSISTTLVGVISGTIWVLLAFMGQLSGVLPCGTLVILFELAHSRATKIGGIVGQSKWTKITILDQDCTV